MLTIGLTHLTGGNIDDAETFLQLAARWAQNPLEQLVALNNTGALQWYKLAYYPVSNDGKFDLWQHRVHDFMQNAKITPSGNTTTVTTTVASPGSYNLNDVKINKSSNRNTNTLSVSSTNSDDQKPIIPPGTPAQQGLQDAINGWLEAVNEANNQHQQVCSP